jgi:two-component system, NarL family, invasion response regulator UvrY
MNKDEEVLRIAYADDHVAMRQGLISILESRGGIRVIAEADNGSELILKLSQLEVLPDVCMVDINMPVTDGFEVMQAIRKNWPGLKTLILTVFENESYIIRMIKQGANGYLLKSCHPDEIKMALFNIHNSGYHYSGVADNRLFRKVFNRELDVPKFSDREIELLRYSCTDLSYQEIAERMNTSPRSVDGIRDRLFARLGLSNRVSMAMLAVQYGYVPVEINTSGSFLNQS